MNLFTPNQAACGNEYESIKTEPTCGNKHEFVDAQYKNQSMVSINNINAFTMNQLVAISMNLLTINQRAAICILNIFNSFAVVYGGLYVPLDDPSPLVVTTTTNIYYTAILLIDRIVFYIWLFIIC